MYIGLDRMMRRVPEQSKDKDTLLDPVNEQYLGDHGGEAVYISRKLLKA